MPPGQHQHRHIKSQPTVKGYLAHPQVCAKIPYHNLKPTPTSQPV